MAECPRSLSWILAFTSSIVSPLALLLLLVVSLTEYCKTLIETYTFDRTLYINASINLQTSITNVESKVARKALPKIIDETAQILFMFIWFNSGDSFPVLCVVSCVVGLQQCVMSVYVLITNSFLDLCMRHGYIRNGDASVVRIPYSCTHSVGQLTLAAFTCLGALWQQT